MGELESRAVRFQLRALRFVSQGIEGKMVDNLPLVLIHDEIDVVVNARKQGPARLQHAPALPPDGPDLPDVAVGDRMEDQVEGLVRERQRLCHIGPHDGDGIALPLGHHALAGKLPFGIVQHRAFRAQGSKNRHLLTAAAGKAEDALALQFPEPGMGDRLCRRQQNVPMPPPGSQKRLMTDGFSPFPAFLDPAVDRQSVDILVVHPCLRSLLRSIRKRR